MPALPRSGRRLCDPSQPLVAESIQLGPCRDIGTNSVVLKGKVASGYGIAREKVRIHCDELRSLTGESLLNGSLNVVLRRPVQFDNARALAFDNGRKLLWKGSIRGIPVWLYRWKAAPLHIIEILSAAHLRDTLGVDDGDELAIEVPCPAIGAMSLTGRLAWSAFWQGRVHWYYRYRLYSRQAERLSKLFGANQSGPFISLLGARLKKMEMLSKTRTLLSTLRRRPEPYHFERLRSDASSDPKLRTEHQIMNLLNYTKTSGSTYSARLYPAGYHTIELNGKVIPGQRNPANRLALAPFDFEGKSVLDIGCNQGGMLFEIDRKVRWGIGIDYDHRMVNAANFLNRQRGGDRLSFYVFNLEKEPLDLITDFLPEGRVDIVFLLSVCMWLENWREVVAFAAGISTCMLFETNGTLAQQNAQQQELEKLYHQVSRLSEASEDDPRQRNRRLYFCEGRRDR